MTSQIQLPENVSKIGSDEPFNFACHPKVHCFTNCCRELELALTPYDILRLKRETRLDSASFLDRYVIQEQDATDAFPRFYLTMIDDGQASCVFVSDTGCRVYSGRPGACRAYPMGRAVTCGNDQNTEEFFVLLREPHCHGFLEGESQTTVKYCKEQGLQHYNYYNDKVANLLQHEQIRRGMRLTIQQVEFFVLALYNLDAFRTQLNNKTLPQQDHYSTNKTLYEEDEQLLLYGIEWLHRILFQK